jgi:phosphoglucosamine mutase
MLEFLRVVARSGGSANTLSDAFENYPQLMANVAVANKDGWEENAAISAVIGEAQTALADGGRVVVRASGTQPMIRVMLEGPDREAVDRELKRIVAVMEREIGGHVEGWVDLTHSLGD